MRATARWRGTLHYSVIAPSGAGLSGPRAGGLGETGPVEGLIVC